MEHLVDAAFNTPSNIDPEILGLPGMSGRKYREFINNLVASVPNARYLEVGCWAGSTLCAALNGNSATAVAIDNWSEFGGPRDVFIHNVNQFVQPFNRMTLIDNDFRQVDFPSLGKFNIYLYDGPHKAVDQFDGIAKALDALDPKFVLVVDDWNWAEVREGTLAAIDRLGLEVTYSAEIRTTDDDSHPQIAGADSDWHNGYYIAVVEQPSVS